MFTDTVSVSPRNIIPRHYGSVFAISDYTSKAHNIYMAASYVPKEDLRVYTNIVFSRSKASLDEVVMPDVEDRLDGDLEEQDFTFEEMPTYSEQDFELLTGQLGFEYNLSPEVVWTAEGMYGNLWGYAPYVFGDESGSIFMIRTGFRLDL